MAKQTINIGSSANDGTGDPLRTAFDKINDNFTELYNASPATAQVTISGNQISANESNADLVLSGSGTGDVVAGAVRIHGTSITSDDSSQIQINENLDVGGNITASGNITATGNIFANGNINLGNAADDQTKVVGVFEADQVQIDGTTITTNTTNGSLTLTGNGTGGVNIDNLTFNDNSITSASNADINLTPGGTGGVVASGIRVKGTTLSADDSSTINLNEGVNVDGTLNVEGATTVAAITASGVATFSGTAVVDNITINDSTISTSSNADLNLTPGGTGGVIASGLRFSGTTISADDSSLVNINEALNVDGNATVEGTLNTKDVATTGNTTVTGNSTVSGTLTVQGSITADTIVSNSNGDITIDPAGTGAIVLTGPITATGTQTTTGQLNVDNLRLDGNVLSATSGGITLTPADGQNVTVSGTNVKLTAGEANFTLMEATTVRADTIQNDTSNGDISISTQGTGNINVNSLKINNLADPTAAQDAATKAYVDARDIGDLSVTGSTISAPSNANLTLNAGGTGSVDIDAIQIKGTSISSTDSTQININENVEVDGTLSVTGEIAKTGDLIVNVSGSLILDADSGTVFVRDGSAGNYGQFIRNGSNDLTIASGSTQALIFTGANAAFQGTLSASGTISNSQISMEGNRIKTTASNADLQLETAGTGLIDIETPTQMTVGAVGAASKLPLDSANEIRPVGYLRIKISGTEYVIPYFNAS